MSGKGYTPQQRREHALPELRQRRDHALRDLLELDRQVDDGELVPEVEVRLRREYEREAGAAITALDRLATSPLDRDAARKVSRMRGGSRSPRVQPRQLLYGLGALVLVAAAVLLPGYVLDRPKGGFVTGNEALQSPGSTQSSGATGGETPDAVQQPVRDLSKVTDQEMEAVVAENPDVIGMRIALADRYTAKGRYDLAVVHYRKVLELEPGSVEGKAHLGWLLLQLNQPDEAARLVDEVLATDPELSDALWFKANIRLYGFDDAKGAIKVLDDMSRLSTLSPEVRGQVETLRREASAQAAKGS